MRHSNQILVAVALAIVALTLPLLVGGNRFTAFVLGVTFISILWASGMNLLYGFVGLMPLMFGGVAGIAAYTMIHLTQTEGWSFWTATPAASIFAALIGVILGLPSLRLKGFYFALCSLVIQSVLTLAFIFFPQYTNGDTGISQIPAPDWFGGERLKGVPLDFLLAVAAVAGVFFILFISRTRLGKRLVAIREDDVLAATLGIKVLRERSIAFFIVSIYAGLGGCLYATYVGFVSPRSFDVLLSLNVWLFVAFGGRGTIVGPIIGAMILAPLPFLLQELQAFKDIISGILIIIVTLVMPSGIYGEYLRRKNSKAQSDKTGAANARSASEVRR
jgi:branched-chain amino acid transport system permease protein